MTKIPNGRFPALLVSYQGSRALVRDESGREFQCKMRQIARDSVTGDQVVVELVDDEPVISERSDRASEFFRTDMRGQKKMIAANLNCLAIVVAAEPEPHLGLIDRYLVGAELCGLKAEIVINKSDLADHPALADIRRIYPQIGYGVTSVSAKQVSNLDELRDWAANKKLAFLGQSGVGKSSLINALTSQAHAAVGSLSTKRAKGRHTTTSSFIYEMPFGGWIMDSPGIRDFENAQWKADEVIRGFPELYEASLGCKFRNCRHINDKGCAIVECLKQGELEPSRFENYRAIVSNTEQ